MALSSEELEKRVENMVKAHVDRLTREIDTFFLDNRLVNGRKGPYTYKVGCFDESIVIRFEVLDKIIEAYKTVGWDVSYDTIQRELTFSAKKQ